MTIYHSKDNLSNIFSQDDSFEFSWLWASSLSSISGLFSSADVGLDCETSELDLILQFLDKLRLLFGYSKGSSQTAWGFSVRSFSDLQIVTGDRDLHLHLGLELDPEPHLTLPLILPLDLTLNLTLGLDLDSSLSSDKAPRRQHKFDPDEL